MLDIVNEINELDKDLIKWRRDLHQFPELGLNLPKTVKYVTDVLDSIGVKYYKAVNGNAVVALVEGSKQGKVLAIRADMDGLPIKEETGLSFASTNDNMHACGHDGHTAVLLATTKVLYDNRHLLNGTVKLLFQPGEESPGGALPMIEEGVLDTPKVDAIIGLHAGLIDPLLKKGQIGINYGPSMASVDIFKITIIGKGSHAAYPEQSIDPIAIGSELVLALHKLVSREIGAVEPAVLSITKFNGGSAHNIIPNEIEIEGTIRTVSPNTRDYLSKRLEEVTKGITEAFNAKYKLEYTRMYPALINDKKFTKYFKSVLEKIVEPVDIIELEKPMMSAEDFAYYLERVPGTFFFLSNMNEIDGVEFPHHHPKFDIDDSYLKKGVEIFVKTAIDYLK